MDSSIADETETTALIEAAKSGHRKLISPLLDNEAETEGSDEKFGGSALILAALRGHTGTVELLLKRGADINATENKNGMRAFVLAAVQGHADMIAIQS